MQNFKQLMSEMRVLRDQIDDIVQHMDYDSDMLLDVKLVRNEMPMQVQIYNVTKKMIT